MKCPYLTTLITVEEPRPPMNNDLEYLNADETREKTVTYCYGRTTTQIETMSECINYLCAAYQHDHCVRTS